MKIAKYFKKFVYQGRNITADFSSPEEADVCSVSVFTDTTPDEDLIARISASVAKQRADLLWDEKPPVAGKKGDVYYLSFTNNPAILDEV